MNIFSRLLEKIFSLTPVEEKECKGCEHLKLLLEQERVERTNLIQSIIRMNTKEEVTIRDKEFIQQPIMPRHKPWNILKAELEAQDRKKNQILQEQNKGSISTEELQFEIDLVEKELINAGKISETIPVHGNGSPRERENGAEQEIAIAQRS